METTTPHAPLVSVCLPVYNGSRWITEAIDSALAQTYPNVEVVVSNNASTDDTAEVVSSYTDPRVRLETASERVTMSGNHNRTVRLARGSFLKFLHADDRLLPTSVEEMMGVALEDERVGLVFAPREVELEDPSNPDDVAWKQQFGELHQHFTHLERLNDGRDLLRQIVEADVTENWIGEPTSVLVRRQALLDVGGFNIRISQRMDLELWLRILTRYRVGFVDHVLSVYRHHSDSTTATNARTANDSLDNVWLFYTLWSLDDTSLDRARLRRLRRKALVDALSVQTRRALHGRVGGELLAYATHRVSRRSSDLNWSLADPRTVEPVG